jgi:outer membrane receptor protein involved in Fe transport
LKRDSFNVSTPLVSLDSDALTDAGLGSMALILIDEVPAIFESSSNTNTQSSIGSTGLTTINLRQLGTNRTLTLIDGRRTVSNSYSGNYVSLNTIPRGMIERVEVVTGGSTATYGSDAVAGVVNIITETDKEGFSFYARGGETSEGGGEEYTLNADFGTTFADGRGYLFAGVTYDKLKAVISACATLHRPLTIGTAATVRQVAYSLKGEATGGLMKVALIRIGWKREMVSSAGFGM